MTFAIPSRLAQAATALLLAGSGPWAFATTFGVANRSKVTWTFKQDPDPNSTFTLYQGEAKVPNRMEGGQPKPNYYDLAPGQKYEIHIEKPQGLLHDKAVFYLGGPNRVYNKIEVTSPASQYASIHEATFRHLHYEHLAGTPEPVLPAGGDDVVALPEQGQYDEKLVIILKDNYSTKAGH